MDRKEVLSLAAEMINQKNNFLPIWQEIKRYLIPEKGLFLGDLDTNSVAMPPDIKFIKDLNCQWALQTAVAGIFNGITPKNKTWFGLKTNIKYKYRQYGLRAKRWLQYVTNGILEKLDEVGFYLEFKEAIEENLAFGQAVMQIYREKGEVKIKTLTCGEYSLGVNNEVLMEFKLTRDDFKRKYGFIPDDCNNLKSYDYIKLKSLYCKNTDKTKDSNGLIRDYIEYVIYKNKIIHKSSSDYCNYIVFRWKKGNRYLAYGVGDGFKALSVIRAAQKEYESFLIGGTLEGNPPLQYSADREINNGGEIKPGAVLPMISASASTQFSRIYGTPINLAAIQTLIVDTREMITKALNADVFVSISGKNKQMTVPEIQALETEQLLRFDTLFEYLHTAMDDIISTMFLIMRKNGEFDDAPEELEGQKITVSYSGMLAQAQKMYEAQKAFNAIGQITQLAQAYPEIMTKIDALKLVDFYLDGYGVSLDFVKDNDEVQQILQKQAQQQQEVMDQQNMAMGAKTQKDLAQAQEAEANAQIE